MRTSLLVCMSLILAVIAGCGGKSSSEAQRGQMGGGQRGTKPYTIRGETYYPLLSAHGFREEGIASWYGRDFHGKKTANGERYDMHGMTAAHKLLPFNTQVKVTNKSNGKSIVVRINDRGPFVANRVIDLTRTGAQKLDMLGPGTAPVVVESIGTVPGLKPLPASGRTSATGVAGTAANYDLTGRFYVQIGAFSSKANADNLVGRMQAAGFSARTYYSDQVCFWRVQVGPYSTLSHAEEAGRRLLVEYPQNFVVAE